MGNQSDKEGIAELKVAVMKAINDQNVETMKIQAEAMEHLVSSNKELMKRHALYAKQVHDMADEYGVILSILFDYVVLCNNVNFGNIKDWMKQANELKERVRKIIPKENI